MNTASIKTHKADATRIISTHGWFEGIYQFHRFEFWRTTQSALGKRERQQLKRICIVAHLARNLAHKMYHMRIKMHFTKMIDNNFITATTKIISSKINKHRMLCVFFCIFQQLSSKLFIFFIIAGSFESASDWMHDRLSAFYDQLRLRT